MKNAKAVDDVKRRFCKPLVLHTCLLLFYSLLGIFGISQLRRKRTTDSEYLYISGGVGENQAFKSLFSVKREHFTFADASKKVVPRQTGSKEEYFYTADEKTYYILRYFNRDLLSKY